MKKAKERKPTRLIMENGKPSDVIISIKEYEKLLERVEDAADLAYIRRLTKKQLKSRPFEEFMAEHFPGV